MLVQESGMTYDSNDSRCNITKNKVNTVRSANSVAIVKCFDDKTGHPLIFYGIYDELNPEKSIADIMGYGANFYSALQFWNEELKV